MSSLDHLISLSGLDELEDISITEIRQAENCVKEYGIEIAFRSCLSRKQKEYLIRSKKALIEMHQVQLKSMEALLNA